MPPQFNSTPINSTPDINNQPQNFQNTPAPNFVSAPPPEKRRGKGALLLLVILALIVVGGGVFAFNKYGSVSGEKDAPRQDFTEPLSTGPRSHLIATVAPDLVIPGSLWGPSQIGFSHNGNEVVYPGLDKNTKKTVLVKNNSIEGTFFDIEDIVPSKDGARVSYVARLIKKDFSSPKDLTFKDIFYVINGVEQVYHPSGTLGDVIFSADGRNYVYGLSDYKKGVVQIIFNNKEIFAQNVSKPTAGGTMQPYLNTIAPSMTLDAKRIGAALQHGSRQEVVIIDTDSGVSHRDPLVDQILSLVVFSSDGVHYFYRASNGKEEFVVLDGIPQKSFATSGVAWPPVLSHDGKKIAYATKRTVAAKEKIEVDVIDLENSAHTPFVKDDFPASVYLGTSNADEVFSNPDFNPNSATIFDRNKKNKVVITLDLTKHEDQTLLFEVTEAEKNKDVIKMSELADKVMLFFVEINGKKIEKLFQFVSTPQFSDDGAYVSFGVREGRALKWMVYDLQKAEFVE